MILEYILFIYIQIMAQPSVRFGTNPQPTYNLYEYSSAINPNIAETSGIRGTYEVPQASSYISSPTTKITFNQPGGVVSTSKVIANTIGYTPPQAQTSQVIPNAANPQTVNISRTEVKERPAEVRTSNVQQAGAPSSMSNYYGGGRISYAVSGDRPIDDKWPKWVWPLVALLGVFLLTFGLLWGLGVFGGTKAKGLDKVAAAAPKTTKESTPTSTPPTTTSKSGSTTTNVTPTTTTATPTTVSSSTTSTTPSGSPASIPAQTIAPVQVKTASTASPTTKTTVITTTQPTSTTTQLTYQPNYPNSIPAIPASIAPMTSSTTPTQPTTTVTTQSVAVQPSATTSTAAATEPTSSTTATTQPSSTTTAATQPSSTIQPSSTAAGSTQPTTTTVTTTTTTKTA